MKKLFIIVAILFSCLCVLPTFAETFIDCNFNSAPSSEDNGGTYTCDTGSLNFGLSALSNPGGTAEHVTTGGWGNSGAAKFYSITNTGGNRWLDPGVSTSTTRQNIRWLMKFTSTGAIDGKWIDFNGDSPRTWLSFAARSSDCGIGEVRPEPTYDGTSYAVHCGDATSNPCGSYKWCCDSSYGVTWSGTPLSTCTEESAAHGELDLADYVGEWVCVEMEKHNDGTQKTYVWTQDGAYDGLYMTTVTSTSESSLGQRPVGAYQENVSAGSWLIDEVKYADTYIGPPAGFVGGDSTAPTVVITTSDPQNITSNTLAISGTASDAVGVTGCKFRIGAAPTESTGTAITGTTAWSGTATGFSEGANTLYVGCDDAANNWGSDSITVNFTYLSDPILGIIVSNLIITK